MSNPTDFTTREIKDLVQRFSEYWWQSSTELPFLGEMYTPEEQQQREQRMDGFVDDLMQESRRLPEDASIVDLQDYLISLAGGFITQGLGFEPRHVDALRSYGFLEAAIQFAQMARQFDPAISPLDIFQASRNVWSMNLVQLLMGLPVQVTPSVFAYSMLYPYTDNYLDDPAIYPQTKRAFDRRFRLRIQGQTITPDNRQEEIISELISQIESQFERGQYPQVYQSLLDIHTAQGKSLSLLKPDASPYEVDVLGIVFEKGGTSVLADGYLVAGDLTEAQSDFLFYYGTFTQLVDDLEDVEHDLEDGIQTVFSQTARHWTLDRVTNRTFHYGALLLESLDNFKAPGLEPLKEMIWRSVSPLLIDAVGQAEDFYSPAYRKELEAHYPFRFSHLSQQRQKLGDQHQPLMNILETLLFKAYLPSEKKS